MDFDEAQIERGVREDEYLRGLAEDEQEIQPATDHQAFADELRALADFYEKNEALPLPHACHLELFNLAKEQLPAISKALGRYEKVTIGRLFILRKPFGKHTRIDANFGRADVCERIVTGRETIREKVPIAFEERDVEQDVVEWKCPESILGPKGLPLP